MDPRDPIDIAEDLPEDEPRDDDVGETGEPESEEPTEEEETDGNP